MARPAREIIGAIWGSFSGLGNWPRFIVAGIAGFAFLMIISGSASLLASGNKSAAVPANPPAQQTDSNCSIQNSRNVTLTCLPYFMNDRIAALAAGERDPPHPAPGFHGLFINQPGRDGVNMPSDSPAQFYDTHINKPGRDAVHLNDGRPDPTSNQPAPNKQSYGLESNIRIEGYPNDPKTGKPLGPPVRIIIKGGYLGGAEKDSIHTSGNVSIEADGVIVDSPGRDGVHGEKDRSPD